MALLSWNCNLFHRHIIIIAATAFLDLYITLERRYLLITGHFLDKIYLCCPFSGNQFHSLFFLHRRQFFLFNVLPFRTCKTRRNNIVLVLIQCIILHDCILWQTHLHRKTKISRLLDSHLDCFRNGCLQMSYASFAKNNQFSKLQGASAFM